MAEAIFAAGCFWGVEEAFRQAAGVTDTEVGYTGGTVDEPTYEQVCSGRTGHAEAVRVVYDEARTSYEDLLRLFFEVHDPTQVDRQGPDVGTQYRSAIFFRDEAQEKVAKEAIASLNESLKGHAPVATELVAAGTFWPAENYHQQYIAKQRQRTGWFDRLVGS